MSFDAQVCPDLPEDEERMEGFIDRMAGPPNSGVKRSSTRITTTGCIIDGKFVLGEQAGEGACGIVYRARQFSTLARPLVALKMLKPGIAGEEAMRRFKLERQSLLSLNHPGIPQIYESGVTQDGRPYIAMEWVDGVPITEWWAAHRDRPALLLAVFLQVCAVVFYAHSRGIVHRDLKPQNILITTVSGRPEVKVIDFGIAKALCQDLIADGKKTMEGTFLGTPEYMSPEQVKGQVALIDAQSDVYALGAVLYELLTGKPPLVIGREADREEWRQLIVQEAPVPPSQVPGAVPMSGDLDRIVLTALAKDKAERYITVQDFAAELAKPRAGAKGKRKRKVRPRLAKNLVGRNFATAVAGLFMAGITVAASLAYQTWRQDYDDAAEQADVRRYEEAIYAVKHGAVSTQKMLEDVRLAVRIAEPYVKREDTRLNWLNAWSEAKRWEGVRLLESADDAGAEQALMEGYEMLENHGQNHAMSLALKARHCRLTHEMAAVCLYRKDLEGDLLWRRREVAIAETIAQACPTARDLHYVYWCANLQYELACRVQANDVNEASGLVDKSIQGFKTVYESPSYPDTLARVLSKYGTALEKRIQIAVQQNELEIWNRALRCLIALSEDAFEKTREEKWGYRAAFHHAKLAEFLTAQGDVEGGREEYRAAIAAGEKLLPFVQRMPIRKDMERWSQELRP